MRCVGLYLGLSPHFGGSFQYCQSMLLAVSNLDERRYEVKVVYSRREWERYLRHYDIPGVFVPKRFIDSAVAQAFWHLRGPVKMWRRLSPHVHGFTRRLLAQSCDLWIFPSQDSWTYRIPVPAVGVIHDLMHRYERRFPEVGRWWNHNARERHYGNMCKYAELVLVDSLVGQRQVVDSYGISVDRIAVLPFAPPTYLDSVFDKSDSANLRKLPTKFIFYPAQFWSHKNHDVLVRAASRLVKNYPDFNLVFVGSKKNAYATVVSLVRKLELTEHVTFLGYVADESMPELYRRARAMVMPTYFGPTNIPPLEAFAMGCPAAVSRVYGMPEQVGNAALTFDPDSLSEVISVIERLWSDDELCATLSQRGRQRVRNFEQAKFNERLAEILERLFAVLESR